MLEFEHKWVPFHFLSPLVSLDIWEIGSLNCLTQFRVRPRCPVNPCCSFHSCVADAFCSTQKLKISLFSTILIPRVCVLTHFFFTFLPHNFYCVFFFALRDVFSLVRFSVPRDLIFLAKGNQRRRNPSCVDSGSSGQGFFAYFL